MAIVATIFILLGLFFFTVGTIGILRLPDFYTRLQAAGKCDSLAAILVLIGIVCYLLGDFTVANLLVAAKILLIGGFIFVASPAATHAITAAALIVGVEPWTKEKKGK
jgi:multicomponent Na+:H+ antiporter subunit G